ncbi:MAG: pyridoxamine 5'-phosphate oxidase [Saprospiraceae bacterium]|nr:pyridoxamine 5'-phosphate oxidase [Saprospiraceae bacterium]
MLIDLKHLREEYSSASLELTDVPAEPIALFEQWMQEALQAKLTEPNAMTLATCKPDGFPSARVVLLKGLNEEGFIFYTNYNSHKGQELAANPKAALVFLWLELQRQVRIEGIVEKISAADSEAYFQSRPKGSQIGAVASPQSTVIPGREVLEEKVKALEQEYANQEKLPCPEHWGGYIVKPTQIEFWKGRASRLHDRLVYTKLEGKGEGWKIERLAP